MSIITLSMSPKLISIVIATLILLGGTWILISSKNNPTSTKAIVVPTTTPTPSPVILLTWVDEAGFSFQYPEGTSIDKHSEDTKNYANLTLTLPSREVINIVMSDNTFKNLDAWVGQNSAVDTNLENCPAKKIFENDQETIACIDNEVLIKITGNNLSAITKSWKFIYPTPTSDSKKTPASDENILEEE